MKKRLGDAEFEVVERQPRLSELHQAVLQTAETGQAVRINMDGLSSRVVRATMHNLGKTQRLKVHCRDERDGWLTVWMEKVEPMSDEDRDAIRRGFEAGSI